MKTHGPILRCNVVLISFACLFFLATSFANAQSVTSSPGNLAFGVPTGSTSSVAQPVTVSITGATPSSPVTFGTSTITKSGSVDYSKDFSFSSSCDGQTYTSALASCQVAVTFTPSTPANTLESATLTITYNTSGSIVVPLTGALGSIQLWTSTTVQPSLSSASFTNLYTIASANLNLSCPASPTAKLSGTPDGSGYVMVDNYITLSINGAPVSTYLGSLNNEPANSSALYPTQVAGLESLPSPAFPPGNICQNSDAYPDIYGDNTYPECFSQEYRNDVSSLIGVNADSIANPGNSNPSLDGAAGGVTPLGSLGSGNDLGTNFFAPPLDGGAGNLQALFQALDAGGYYETSTMFLVTNCSIQGVVPGGTVTGTTITPTNPISTGVFDSAPDQNISIIINNTGATSPATNATPIFGNYGISQTQFQTLVNGTSAGPTACLLISGEVVNGQTLCKGFKVQCYAVTNGIGTISGDNCGTSTLRNLVDSAKYSSPDTPLPATIANTFITSCNSYVTATTGRAGQCAQSSPPSLTPSTLIGPGFLLFGDGIVTPCTASSPCPPLGYTVNGAGSCALNGALTGNLCPLNTITSYIGASDGQPKGSTVPSRNSIYVPVMNMPLPFTWVTSSNINPNGWANSTTANITFQSNAPTYNPTTGNPSANGWTQAKAPAPYSLIYLIQPASQALPDTTYAPPGAFSNFNPASGVNDNYSAAPICPAGLVNTPFSTPASFGGLADGSFYNVVYFTTACDYSEELYYNPTSTQLSDPTANWASFPVLPFGVDLDPPTVTCSVTSPSFTGSNNTTWYGGPSLGVSGAVALSCTANDNIQEGLTPSGIWQITSTINGVPTTTNETLTPNPLLPVGGFVSTIQYGPPSVMNYLVSVPGTSGQVTTPTTTQTATDAAGNLSTTLYSATFNIDLQPPTINVKFNPAAGNYVAGQTSLVTITYTCSDGQGSGLATCNGSGLPAGATTTCPALGSCTATFVPSAVPPGPYTFSVSSTDNVGNASSYSQLFSVSYSPAKVALAPIPTLAVPGTNMVLLVVAGDENPATNPVYVYGANISVQLQIPTNVLASGTASAIYADVTCSTFPCTITPSGGAGCSVSPTSVSGSTTTVLVNCNVGTIGDLAKNKTAVVVKITVPISSKAPKNATINATGTMTATTPITLTNYFPLSIPVL